MLRKILNNIVKTLGYIGIRICVLFLTFLLSVFFTSIAFTVFHSVWSIITTLPEVMQSHFALYFLAWCVPLTIVFYVYVEFDTHGLNPKKGARHINKQKKKENKE